MTIAVDWLAKRARLSPRKTALIDTVKGRRLSYEDWNANANRTARLLERLGVGRGDRVAVLANNCVEYLDLLFACNKLGAVLQNLNWRLAAPELETLIKHAQPVVFCYGGKLHDAVRKLRLRRDVPSVKHFVALDEKLHADDIDFFERDELSPAPLPAPGIRMSDSWVICYTGGSTGLPKGVILSYANIEWNAVNTVMSWGLGADDTAILDSSLFHTGGLNVFTTPLVYAGGTSVVCESFEPDQVFDGWESGEVTVYFGVPTMFILLQSHPRWKKADLSKLRFVISGGAPCPPPVFERFWAKGVDFKTGYGLTEAGPNTFWLPKDQVRQKLGSVGYPLFHIELKLVHPNGGAITEPHVPGELWIRGAHRTPGYWNNPVATAAAIDDEGWFHSGDLAMVDEDGAYTIVGRAKDMYISGGENVYPAEVEAVIYGHPDVVEAAVFELEHPTWGEVGRAVVALRPGAEPDERALSEYMRSNMAHFKVPHSVVFVESLPKTGAGKIDKRMLRERFGSL
jgi:fatty-acyl-CoA synthase